MPLLHQKWEPELPELKLAESDGELQVGSAESKSENQAPISIAPISFFGIFN